MSKGGDRSQQHTRDTTYRNHRAAWTVADMEFVKQHYGALTAHEVAAELGRSTHGVRKIITLLGLGKPRVGKWCEKENALLMALYNNRQGINRLLTLLAPRTKEAIRVQASKLGVAGGHRSWSSGEQQFLIEHYGKTPTREIARKLGRNISAVRSTACKLNLSKKCAGIWTEKEVAVLNVHYDNGAGMAYIQALLPERTKEAIAVQASKMGITRTRDWHINEEYILRQYYPILGRKVSDKLPGRTVPAIQHHAKKMGLKYRHR